MDTGCDLAADFRLLLLVGCLAFEGEDWEGFDADGSSVLQKDVVSGCVVNSTIKTYNSGTPSGYFSRRRRTISTFFRLALRLSLY